MNVVKRALVLITSPESQSLTRVRWKATLKRAVYTNGVRENADRLRRGAVRIIEASRVSKGVE